jgi:hypothetical protein
MDTGNPVVYRLTVKRDGSRTVEWPTLPSDDMERRVATILSAEAAHLRRDT